MKLSEIAAVLGIELQGDGNAECLGIREPQVAGPSDLAFIDKGRRFDVESLKALALIVARDSGIDYPNLLLADKPRLAFCRALELFHPHRPMFPGISPQASVSSEAILGTDVSVGPFAVIAGNVEIGEGSEIHPHAVIYPGVRIGRRCVIYAGAVLREEVELGDRVIIQPGAVVGADGFGYLIMENGEPRKIPQVGSVRLDDSVELGANSCVDRGMLSQTRVHEHAKLDNLVQVAHNVDLGPRCRLSAQTGISGSVKIGADVVMGGQAGVADHATIPSGSMIAAQAGISGTIKDRGIFAGSPHQDMASWRRNYVILKNLEAYAERIKKLEKRLEELSNER